MPIFHKMKIRSGLNTSGNGSCRRKEAPTPAANCYLSDAKLPLRHRTCHLNLNTGSIRAFRSSRYQSIPPRRRGQTGATIRQVLPFNSPLPTGCTATEGVLWCLPVAELNMHTGQVGGAPPWLLND